MSVIHEEMQYRYYEMPPDSPVLALLGSGWVRPYGSDLEALHFHNYMEIGYCYDGVGKMIFRDKAFDYGKKTFTLIPPNYPHNTVAQFGTMSKWEYLFVDVDSFVNKVYVDNPQHAKRLIERIYDGAHVLQRQESKRIAALILDIMETYREKGEFYLECAKGLLLALLTQIAGLTPLHDQEANTASKDYLLVQRAIAFIAANFQEKIQMGDIAAACFVSETHFRRMFTQAMQLAPLAYVNVVRVEAACKMLRTTDYAIHEVANRCGFTSLPSFNRNFKALMGVTPLQWRKDTIYYEQQLEKQNIMVFNGWQ